jgi:hypothetical protein
MSTRIYPLHMLLCMECLLNMISRLVIMIFTNICFLTCFVKNTHLATDKTVIAIQTNSDLVRRHQYHIRLLFTICQCIEESSSCLSLVWKVNIRCRMSDKTADQARVRVTCYNQTALSFSSYIFLPLSVF